MIQMDTKDCFWDTIVVGTGPAGATVARDLAKKNKKVLILEKGHEDHSIHIPRMLKTREMMFIGKGKTLVRGVRTGGSSILYYGTAYKPPLDFFLQYGIDLSKEIDEVRKDVPISPLRDDLIGPGASIIMESARDLGFSWNKLNKFIFQEIRKVKQWSSVQFIRDAVEDGAELINGADVQKVILQGKQAVGVEWLSKGEHHRAYASQIILAAGGISSPQILQRTGMNRAGDGFFCDPLIIVQGTIEGIAAGKEIPMTTGLACEEEGYILTDITLPRLVYQVLTAQAFRLNRLFHHNNTVGIMVKIKDSIGGKITAQGKVQKKFTQEDKQKMQQGYFQAREILEHAGAKGIFHTPWTSAHPGGSVRIGELVDSNLQTEYKNLYVCDCSVIPTEWGLPPTWTMLSLGKRLANFLS
jgi:choline dehydrogenase-like flavoprotein